MDKLKTNVFWVIIGLALVAELVVFAVVVRGKASANESRLSEITSIERKLNSLKKDAVNNKIIAAADQHKLELQREYARMVLHMITIDDNLDNFGSVEIPPSEMLSLAGSQKPPLIDALTTQTNIIKEEANGLVPEDATSVWDFVQLPGRPSPTALIYAFKQVWVQKALVDVMKQPSGKGNLPLVAAINKIEFEIPSLDRKNNPQAMPTEDRYVYYRFNIDVLMPAASVPVLFERILKLDIPVSLESTSVTKATGSSAVGISKAKQKIVNVKATFKLLDVTMAVSKVVFSKDKFADDDAIMQWLDGQNDETAKELKKQISKPGVTHREVDGNLEYKVFGDNSLIVEPNQCEIFDGVTVFYGELPKNLPDTNELRNL